VVPAKETLLRAKIDGPNAAIGIDEERAAAFNIEQFDAALDRAGLRHLGKRARQN